MSFWSEWPKNERKGAKGKCWVLWQRSNFDALWPEINAHVAAMKESDSWKSGYVPAPLVYLGQRRWEGAEEETQSQRRVAMP